MSIPVERLERDVATAAPLITVEVFESFLQCETKSKLYSQGAAETDFEFKKWLRRERDCFKEGGLSWLRTMCQEDQFYVGTPSVEALKQKRWRIIADYIATSAEICAHLDALELTPATPNRMASFYRPLRFVPSEKLTGADRLLLAFDALAISHTMGKTPANGKIIHGSKHRAAVIPGIRASNIESLSDQLVTKWLSIVRSPNLPNLIYSLWTDVNRPQLLNSRRKLVRHRAPGYESLSSVLRACSAEIFILLPRRSHPQQCYRVDDHRCLLPVLIGSLCNC